jgi:hypothetical protein
MTQPGPPLAGEPDPRPDLKRAPPGSVVPGSTRLVDHAVRQVLMTDGTWQHCEILAQTRDRHHGWRVLVLWYTPGDQREDWLIYEPGRFREPQS